MKLSKTQEDALKAAAASHDGTINDADGFTLNTAYALGRRELVVVTTWRAYNSHKGAIGWSAALTDTGRIVTRDL